MIFKLGHSFWQFFCYERNHFTSFENILGLVQILLHNLFLVATNNDGIFALGLLVSAIFVELLVSVGLVGLN